MSDAAQGVTVTHDAGARTYEAAVDGAVMGTLIYETEGPRTVLTHTVVQPSARERGIGSALVAGTLDDLRRQGARITILCPFVTDFIARHPEYADLVDRDHPGEPQRK